MQIEFLTDVFHNLLAKWWVLLLISFGLCGVVLLPLLSGGVVFRGDSTDLIIPQLTFFKNAFEKGESPFWNPYLAAGFPNFVSTLSPFAPASLLVRFLSPTTVHSWYLFFTLSFSLFFFICFLRELEIGVCGSIIGGISYLIGDFYWTQNISTASVVFVQALIFLVFIKIAKSKGVWVFVGYVFAGALTVAYGWIATVVYFANLYYFVALLIFAVFIRFIKGKQVFYKLLLALFLIFTVGFVIGLVQLMPTYVMSQFSGRSGGLEYSRAQGYALTPSDFLHFIHFTPDRGLEAYLYMGIIPFAFCILSFFNKKPFAKFFRWMFIISLIIGFRGSPLFWLINKLPLFNYFQGAARFMLVGSFAGAVLAGFGVEQFIDLLKEKKTFLVKLGCSWFVFGIGCLAVTTIILHPIMDVVRSVSFSFVLLLLAFLGVNLYLKQKIAVSSLLVFFTIITILDFIYVYYTFYSPYSIPRNVYQEKTQSSDFFQHNQGRILPLFADDFDDDFYQTLIKQAPPSDPIREFLYLKETYFPNLQLLAGVENLEANEPLINVDMGRLMALLGTRQLVTSGEEVKLNKMDTGADKKLLLFQERLPLADFLGIRYFMTGYILDENPLDFNLPMVGELGFDFMKTSLGDAALFLIFENIHAKPLVYSSSITDFKRNNKEVYQAFKDSGFRGLFVECTENEKCEKRKNFSNQGEIAIKHKGNGKLEFQTSSSDEQFLIFSQNNLPGWQAFIDNQRTQIYKVNTVFMGIFVPAGSHAISFNYSYWDLFDVGYILKKI